MASSLRRPTWTMQGFHARVKMSKDYSFFVVTEGEEADAYFYDGIARVSKNEQVRAVKVYPVAHVTRATSATAGVMGSPGKTSVLRAYRETKEADALSLENATGRRVIVFCVDRDLTTSHVEYENEPHFCVTDQRDVEAEIFHHSDAVSAFQNLISMDREDAVNLVNDLGNWRGALVQIWRDWILLSAIVVAMDSAPPNVTWTETSLINSDSFGHVDEKRLEIFENKIIEKLGTRNDLNQARFRAEKHIGTLEIERGANSMIKGKWYPIYLETIVQPICSSSKGRVRNGALLAFSGSLNYGDPWSKYYLEKFELAFQ